MNTFLSTLDYKFFYSFISNCDDVMPLSATTKRTFWPMVDI